jgi:hypothetical protein
LLFLFQLAKKLPLHIVYVLRTLPVLAMSTVLAFEAVSVCQFGVATSAAER